MEKIKKTDELNDVFIFTFVKYIVLLLFYNPLSQLILIYLYFWIINILFFDGNVYTKMGNLSHWITAIILVWWVSTGIWSFFMILNLKLEDKQ